MREFIRIISFVIVFAYCIASISCTKHFFTKDDIAGCFLAIKSPPYISNEYMRRDSSTGILYYDINKNAYLEGDTGNYAFTYYVYHRLIMKSLQLHEDGTFICSDDSFTSKAKGTWTIKERDILILNFEQIPKDNMIYVAGLFLENGLFPNEGVRELKIINKNKLRFECPLFKDPNNYKEVTIYKRRK